MKRLSVVLLLLLAAGMLFANGGDEKADDEIIIGFNNGSTTVDFLRQVGESMEKSAAEYGVKLLWPNRTSRLRRFCRMWTICWFRARTSS